VVIVVADPQPVIIKDAVKQRQIIVSAASLDRLFINSVPIWLRPYFPGYFSGGHGFLQKFIIHAVDQPEIAVQGRKPRGTVQHVVVVLEPRTKATSSSIGPWGRYKKPPAAC